MILKSICTTTLLFFFSHATVMAQKDSTTNKTIYTNKINDNKIETNKIIILEKPQEKYVLELKNGKPYNGYEVTDEKLLGEFPFVNYYEEGILKAQYSVDFIEKDFYGKPLEYKFKTTFENGKIADGRTYRETENRVLLTDIYQNGKKTAIEQNIFGMHYFNRISFELKNNELYISNFDTKEAIKIYKKEGFAIADYLRNAKVIETSDIQFQQVSEATPFSVTAYYLDKKDELKTIFLKRIPREPLQTDDHFLIQLYMQFGFQYDGEIADFFEHIDAQYSKNALETIRYESLFESFMVPYTQEDLKGFLFYDSVGIIHEGIKIEKGTNASFTAKTYHNGKVIKEDHIQDLRKDYQPYK